MKNKKNIIFLIAFFALLIICLVLCVNKSFIETLKNNSDSSDTYYESYREEMDIGMKNAGKHEVIAKVNDIEITQTNKDVYLISDKKYSTEELVKMVIIADYTKKQGMKVDDVVQQQIDEREEEMREDETLTEEYCQKAYGISKEEVIAYMTNRSYEIWMNGEFSAKIIDEATSGEIVKKYPELENAYKKFEKKKNKNPTKAFDDLEDAYYEMIAKDYDVIIYKK